MFGDDLAATSLRIIALDRPGIGLSNFQPGRTFADWATDIAALADHLHWPRFGVLGNSGGGPYTAAVASLLPDRVTTAVVVSGAWRMDAPEVKANLPNINRIFWILARRFPPALGLLLHSMRQSDSKAISEAPSEADVKRLESMLPPQDVAALLAPGRMAATSVGVTEALRHGTKGAAWDARMFVHPFGFDHTAIHSPSMPSMVRSTATSPSPSPSATSLKSPSRPSPSSPEDGHLSTPCNHLPEIVAAIKQLPSAPPAGPANSSLR